MALVLLLVAMVNADVSLPNLCAANVTAGLGLGGLNAKYVAVTSSSGCCSACTADPSCVSWTWRMTTDGAQNCTLRPDVGHPNMKNNASTKISGIMNGRVPTPAPPAPPPVPPPPVPPGTQKNIVFIINDDQDLMLGSMRAMPNTARLLGEAGANMSHFRVNTPICCPSRATMFSGRYEHNNKVDAREDGGCMYQNTSQTNNPAFWHNSHIRRLHDEHGYTTGMFGKTLNTWDTYGCKNNQMPSGLDRQLVMCTHVFFDCNWVNDTANVHTGNAPEDYTTSVLGNASLTWIKEVLDMGKDHPPFYAWIGPHAPHLPATPAPWYADHPIGLLKPPRDDVDPRYNYSAKDHHPLVAVQDILNDDDAEGIDAEYAKRMRTLLSVDDIVVDLHALLSSYGEWDNTYVIFSSDHGYSLGQYRIPTHKMQVYDNTLRVPFLIKGPGITPGQQVTALTQFADLAPTLLQLAGANSTPSSIDGRSFAPLIIPTLPHDPRPWRTEHLASYQSIYAKNCLSPPAGKSTSGNNTNVTSTCGRHPIDSASNTHRSIRIVNATHELMYAEFVNVLDDNAWNFSPSSIYFHELYDMKSDPWQLHNMWYTASPDVKQEMQLRLANAYDCRGTNCP